MVSIKQKLKNSPGYFKKHAESTAELPPTPRKAKAASMPMQKMLFKDLISAKYVEKDLEKNENKMDASSLSNLECSPMDSSPLKKVESPIANRNMSLGIFFKKINQTAQRVKVTPKSAPRTLGEKFSAFKKSLSVANTPKGSIDFLKQLKSAKKIVKNSPKVAVTTPRSSNSLLKGSTPNSLLSSRHGSAKKSLSACQSVAKFAKSVAKQTSILDASKDVFFEQVQEFVGISKIAPASEKAESKISPESEGNRRRSVTFGPPVISIT